MRVSCWYSVQLTAHVINYFFMNINNFEFPLVLDYPQVDVQVCSNTVFHLYRRIFEFWFMDFECCAQHAPVAYFT